MGWYSGAVFQLLARLCLVYCVCGLGLARYQRICFQPMTSLLHSWLLHQVGGLGRQVHVPPAPRPQANPLFATPSKTHLGFCCNRIALLLHPRSIVTPPPSSYQTPSPTPRRSPKLAAPWEESSVGDHRDSPSWSLIYPIDSKSLIIALLVACLFDSRSHSLFGSMVVTS